MEDRHISYTEKRYIYTDQDGANHYTDERTVYCGDWVNGRREVCDECLPQMNEEYPQGWRYYPGDVCTHGMYTGGVGIDWICQSCEDGLTVWEDDPRYEMVISPLDDNPNRTEIRTQVEWRESDLQPGTDRHTLQRLARMLRLMRVANGELGWSFHAERLDGGYWVAPWR